MTIFTDKAFIAGFKAAKSNQKRIPMLCKVYQDLLAETKFKLVSELAAAWIKGYECEIDVSLGESFAQDAYFVEKSKAALVEYISHFVK